LNKKLGTNGAAIGHATTKLRTHSGQVSEHPKKRAHLFSKTQNSTPTTSATRGHQPGPLLKTQKFDNKKKGQKSTTFFENSILDAHHQGDTWPPTRTPPQKLKNLHPKKKARNRPLFSKMQKLHPQKMAKNRPPRAQKYKATAPPPQLPHP
jgi:hypothetical protein